MGVEWNGRKKKGVSVRIGSQQACKLNANLVSETAVDDGNVGNSLRLCKTDDKFVVDDLPFVLCK